jgi:hypothetical protein
METAALKCLNEWRLLVPAVDDEHCASLHLFSPVSHSPSIGNGCAKRPR